MPPPTNGQNDTPSDQGFWDWNVGELNSAPLTLDMLIAAANQQLQPSYFIYPPWAWPIIKELLREQSSRRNPVRTDEGD